MSIQVSEHHGHPVQKKANRKTGAFQKELSDEYALRRRISLAEEMSRTLGALDPGFTSRMGRLVKHLAKDRIALAKLLKGPNTNNVYTFFGMSFSMLF